MNKKESHNFKYFLFVLVGLFVFSCKKDIKDNGSKAVSEKQFELVPSTKTNVNFENRITETEEVNFINYEAVYQGAGCAVLDVDNDGLQDLFFVSNQESEKLYLNKGNFKFEDISQSAGITGGKEWSAGVSIADVNADGWDDIYVCCHFWDDINMRRNKLYINNKNNTFTERAREYGIDDPGYSFQANFFDMDLDGDLDLFVVNQPPNKIATRFTLDKFDPIYSCHLYRNDNGKYTDVSRDAGTYTVGFSLSASIADITNDGLPDIYVTSDYNVPDYLFINMGGGKFRNVLSRSIAHTALYSMGSDIADINNDGWLDIFSVDMVAEDHYRNKTNMAGMNIKAFWEIVNSGLHYQYMFNALQLNNGNGTFSEIGQMAGVAKTDWSWAALFNDFDHDGYQDLIVTNGLLKDIRNRDFISMRMQLEQQGVSKLEISSKAPSVPIKNYMYRNEGNLHFENVTDKWGFSDKCFTQGALYADLDNDGDQDIVMNNMNERAFIYRNNNNNNNNYLRLKLESNTANKKSIGARAVIYYNNGQKQLAEVNPIRGYMSSVEPNINFGIGTNKIIDSLVVRWPSGKSIKILKPSINKTMVLNESKAEINNSYPLFYPQTNAITQEVTQELIPGIGSKENSYDDYAKEILIPYKMSTLGPCLAVADVNGDGNDDFYLGGVAGSPGNLYIQGADGGFVRNTNVVWDIYKSSEDIDASFFDADGDNDMDLYVASGSNEFPVGSKNYLDHLYINDGKGNYSDASNKLAALNFSKSVVVPNDIDGDGDLDLFIGGRQVPGKYGMPTRSAILINDKGNFTDQTEKIIPAIAKDFGMVTDAVWADVDKDADEDLILVGEWMSPHVFIKEGASFVDKSKEYGLSESTGWWNSVEAEDLDGDGYKDLICGNVGLNTKFKASQDKPFKVFVKDFDGNGTWDTYLGSYDADGKMYPVRGRQCSSEQMPFIKDKFKNYNDFAVKTIDEVLEGKMDAAIVNQATQFNSGIFFNNGKSMTFQAFDREVQIAPMNDIVIFDIDKDGKKEIIYGGNYYNREVETTRSDAGIGGILLNKGNKKFESLHPTQTGIVLHGDLRKLKVLRSANFKILLGANNNGPLQAYLIGQ